jgi:ribosome biogenesis protein BRX1
MTPIFQFVVGVRNYQIIDKTEASAAAGKKANETQVVVFGPRFVIIPIRFYRGSLCGPTLYQNPAFVSPNDERAAQKKRKG